MKAKFNCLQLAKLKKSIPLVLLPSNLLIVRYVPVEYLCLFLVIKNVKSRSKIARFEMSAILNSILKLHFSEEREE